MASRRVLIDSRMREPGGSVESYTVKLFSPIKNVRGVNLDAAIFPKSIYPVLTGFNDTFQFGYSESEDLSVTLPSKNYDGTQLADELTGLMNAAASAGGEIEVTYDPQTAKLTITSSGSNFQINAQTLTPAIVQLLGFSAVVTGVTAATAEFTINLSWPTYVLVDLDLLQNQGTGDSTWTKHHTTSVPILLGDANFGELEYQKLEDFRATQQVSFDNIYTVKVRIRPPSVSATNPDPPPNWSLNNVDHVLLLRVFQDF